MSDPSGPVGAGKMVGSLVLGRMDGGNVRFGRVVAGHDVARYLVQGQRGRFYSYSTLGSKGVFGFRGPAGESFGFSKANEIIMIILVVVMVPLFFLALILGLFYSTLFFGVFSLFGIVLYFPYRSTRIEARRQFDADAFR